MPKTAEFYCKNETGVYHNNSACTRVPEKERHAGRGVPSTKVVPARVPTKGAVSITPTHLCDECVRLNEQGLQSYPKTK